MLEACQAYAGLENKNTLCSTRSIIVLIMQTSNQAAFLLYYMAKNPEAQEELYQQIRSVLGDRTQPTSEDLSKIPYLKGCIMETFRYSQLRMKQY